MKGRKKLVKSRGKSNKEFIGVGTVRDFRKGEFVKINGKEAVYQRGEYDRELKKYHLVDTRDIYGNGRYVSGDTIARNDFEY